MTALQYPLMPNVLDLGTRCKVRQSSADHDNYWGRRLYPAVLAGGFFFHTKIEQNPWVVLELGRPRTVGQIVVWNREDVGDIVINRPLPLSVSVSMDGEQWQEVVVWHERFGGRLSGKPLVLTFANGLQAAFIKLTALTRTYLHFDYIGVFQHLPSLPFGKYVGLHRDSRDEVVCDYIHQAINGLYSGTSTALHDIFMLSKYGIGVKTVDLSMSFRYFKDKIDEDVHPVYFSPVQPGLSDACRPANFHCEDVHKRYKDLDLEQLCRVASMVFAPSENVKQRGNKLASAAKMSPANTIAIVYRGTDKSTEITLADVENYIDVARALKKKNPKLKIFVQTDQEQAKKAVLAAFGGDCTSFDNLPVTSGKTAIHMLPKGEAPPSRTEFTLDLMAAVDCIARCRYVVTHTGNVGAWIAIYRGSTEGLYQFDATGHLVEPDSGEPSLLKARDAR